MKTPFDDAVAKLNALAGEGFSRGWDNLDRADKLDEIASALGGVHAAWSLLVDERDRLKALLAEATGEVVTRKLGFLLRDYPDDKETRKLIKRIEEIAKGAT